MNGTKRILIVEDDAHVAYLMYSALSMLNNNGYDVHTCRRGDVAWSRLQAERFDLVVTDLCVPGLHGLELVDNMCQASTQTPVLAITAYSTPEMEAMVRGVGAEYLTKPFDPLEFVTLVDRILHKAASQRERAREAIPSAG